MDKRELLEAFANEYWNKKFAPSIEQSDIDSFLATLPEEKASSCWNCGKELKYSENGVTEYHCSCGAVDPAS